MSDPVSGAPSLETRMDDVRAVMDAARSQRAALLGVSEGGPMSILFAATYPERTWALVLFASFPRESWAPDYPFGMTAEEYEQLMRQMTEPEFYERLAAELAPSADALSKRRFADMMRQSGGVRARLELMQMNRELDVRHVLGAIRVPTLVLCSAEDDRTNVAGSRYLAEHIAGARYVELPGVDHAPGGQNADAVLAEIAAFLNDAWDAAQQAPVHDRVLTTVLAVAVGAQHRDAARRELARFRGAEIRTDGDGLVARFDGPARAVRCANAILAALRSLGVDARAGLHTGECQIADGVYSGDAVAAAATVAARAAEGQVLVSAAVRDLLAGSDIAFAEAGMAVLGEPPAETQLWRAAGEAQRAAGG